MEINLLNYQGGKTYHLSQDVDLTDEKYSSSIIRKIKSCHVEIELTDYDNLFRLILNVKANVVVPCAYTLEDVDITVKGNDELDFTDVDDGTEDLIYYSNPNVDLDQYIYSIIVASTPLKTVKKGAKRPTEGKGYRILTEEEYDNEKKNKKDSRWDALDDLDL